MPRPGDTTARGYGHRHQEERKRWLTIVKRGDAICARCGWTIAPDAPFDLDHTDDRLGYLGVSHRRCNRRAGGKKRQALARRTALTW